MDCTRAKTLEHFAPLQSQFLIALMYLQSMKRGWLFDALAALMMGLAQALNPVPKYEPRPPDHAFALPPNLNTAELDELVELMGLDLAQQIIATRPHLSWQHLRDKFPDVDGAVWERLEGKVRF